MPKILGQHIPSEMRNLAINGAMDFFQRNETAQPTSNGPGAITFYSADCFVTGVGGTTAKNFYYGRTTNVPSIAQSGFSSVATMFMTTNIAVSSFAATDLYFPVQYRMEGLDFAKINQKTMTVSFWFTSFIGGTFSLAVRNGALNRSYVTTFAAGANVWQFVTATIPLDTAGTWPVDNTLAMYVDVAAVGGTTFTTSTLNAWQSGNFVSASTSTNWLTSAGSSSVGVTQFSIVEGSLGPGAKGFNRAGKDIQQELAMCQRYFEKSYVQGVAPATAGNFNGASQWFSSSGADRDTRTWYKATKRTAPTISMYSPQTGAGGSGAGIRLNNRSTTTDVTPGLGDGAGDVGFNLSWTQTSGQHYAFHWTADASL